ncbi:MAG TPA: NUDIX hydrolase [Methylomirabilota bacterium]|jgi:ADP-ribose pyrophosphatase|nr:NUDIX hydrolase [Methylomirabilota bacterium]
MASWSPLESAIRYTRGKLALREDTWRLPDGSERIYPVLVVGVGVAVLPFVEPDRVLLVRQYRHLQRGMSWELPGGGALPGESPEAAAQRELREEGGYRAAQITRLTHFRPSNAYLDEIAYCYVATGLTPDPLPADDDEFFERTIVPWSDALRMTLDGEITESFSKVAILQHALASR